MDKKEASYLQMMKENQGMMNKIASVYTRNQQDREDLMQDMAIQLWNSFDAFKGKSSRSTWLYKVALNTALQFIRKEARKIKKSKIEELRTDKIPALEGAEDSQDIQLLFKAIQSLSALDKAIILLYLESRSHKEISAIIGISVSHVGTKIQRIKQKLKENIQAKRK